MTATKIEWATHVWNPITGCTLVSEGCQNCYAAAMHKRFNKAPFSQIVLHEDRLDQPLRWRKPRHVFVNSMSDLFHKDVADAYVLRVVNRMIKAPQHTYLVLTKRAARMEAYFRGKPALPNLWLGVTAENQRRADERIPLLLETPAAKRFVSIEPMLEPVSLDPWTCKWFEGRGIGWVIVGPETGPRRRSCDPEWIMSIISQCREAGVPCFVKAWPMPDGRISKDMNEWPAWARVRETAK